MLIGRGYIELEALLMVCGAVDIPDRRRPGEARDPDADRSDDDDEDNDDPSSRMRSAATATNTRSAKNVRGTAKNGGDNSDSDFEFDM